MMSEQVLHRAGHVLRDVKEIFHGVHDPAHGAPLIPQKTENQYYEETALPKKLPVWTILFS